MMMMMVRWRRRSRSEEKKEGMSLKVFIFYIPQYMETVGQPTLKHWQQ